MNKETRGRSPARAGIALLLTLAILLLLTLLALSFSSSMLMENQAARNFYQAAKAEEMALGGLEAAIAVLREDARSNSYDHLFERWAIYYDGDDGFAWRDSLDESEGVDLSDLDEVEHRLDETGSVTSGTKDPWRNARPDSRWIKVVEQDPITGGKRLTGRYAVCVEDENGKVNINTAGNPDPSIDPRGGEWHHRRNMGFTTAEIDLGAILQGLGVLFHDTAPDVFDYPDYPHNVDARTAKDLAASRYGWTGESTARPGQGERHADDPDDNATSQMPALLRQDRNGVDDDGDGLIDELGEEEDEPGEFSPYDPTAITSPGALFEASTPPRGGTGVMGNDTPYLTVSHVKMARRVSRIRRGGSPGDYSVMDLRDADVRPPYPRDALYHSLLPYITVYSQDFNRVSEGDLHDGSSGGPIEWVVRENVGRWIERGPSEVYDSLQWMKSQRIAFTSTSNETLRQIAVNLYDFADADWFPTQYGDAVGIEPTAYLNEVESAPPDVPGSEIGIEGSVLDWGEWIEIWNPYDIPIDLSRYRVTIDRNSDSPGGGREIGPMAVSSAVVPARGFFVIADTRGYVLNTGGTGPAGDILNLRPRPPNCDAYAPLKLDAPLRMVLEIDVGRGTRTVEAHSDIPTGTKNLVTAQKDDPRMAEWRRFPATFRSMNAGMSITDNPHSYFYMPGVGSRARDPEYTSRLGKPQLVEILQHAGALSSIGELGMVHRGERWRSLNFTGKDIHEPRDRDDGRLLDLLTLPYQYVHEGLKRDPELARDLDLPQAKVVPGRINVNTAAPEILLGLNWDKWIQELEFSGPRVSPAFALAIIRDLIMKRRTDARHGYRNLSDLAEDVCEYPALANVPEAAREAFLKCNANLIATKSSVFKVTVVAEVFDRKGRVAASGKLEAVVDRGHTPGTLGRDGEHSPSRDEKAAAERGRTLYFRWVTEE